MNNNFKVYVCIKEIEDFKINEKAYIMFHSYASYDNIAIVFKFESIHGISMYRDVFNEHFITFNELRKRKIKKLLDGNE